MKLFVCVFALLLSLAAAQDMTTCSTTLTQGSYSATFTAIGDSVTFEVSATTPGWVAIGFSEDTLMPNTDVILGASDGTDSFINDRYANARAQPPVDASEDITDASVNFIGGTTTIRFTRTRGSTDANDISLDQCRYFLYAWGGNVGVYSDPTTVMYHGSTNRGNFANRICIPDNCVADCGNLPPPVDGAITVPATTAGEVANYSCNPGYLLGYGDENRTCQDNGMWSGEAPNCTVVSCPELSAPTNGSVTYEVPGRIFQTDATYACDTGFELNGGMIRDCQAEGTWSGDAPTCMIVSCPELSAPANGSITYQDPNRIFQTTVTYNCDEGFAVNGISPRTCEANEMWSGEAPTCRNTLEVNCPDLTDPVNGMVSFLTTDFGAVANYTCNDGFMLVGVAMRWCQVDDAWTGEEPTCQVDGRVDGAQDDCSKGDYSSGELAGAVVASSVITALINTVVLVTVIAVVLKLKRKRGYAVKAQNPQTTVNIPLKECHAYGEVKVPQQVSSTGIPLKECLAYGEVKVPQRTDQVRGGEGEEEEEAHIYAVADQDLLGREDDDDVK